VHNPLQVFVKVTEQDTALTLGKKQHVIILSPHSSYLLKAKKYCGNGHGRPQEGGQNGHLPPLEIGTSFIQRAVFE